MNIAFEISPLITASGSFGDKSGVYRYIFELIRAFSQELKKRNSSFKILLFSFNLDLLKLPLNPELLELLSEKNIELISRYPTTLKNINIEDKEIFDNTIIRITAIIVNKIFGIKKIYINYLKKLLLENYVQFLTQTFRKNKIGTIFHSQTGFLLLKGFKNVTIIYDLTAIFMNQFHRSETNELYKRKLWFARRFCDGIVCISNATKKDLFRYSHQFRKKKIVVGYPGINALFGNNDTSHAKVLNRYIRKLLGSIKEKKYLLYYGTFEPRKNLIYLVKAFSDLKNTGEIPDDFGLVLIGGDGWGGVKEMIQRYVKENLSTSITVLDYVSDNYLFYLVKNAYAIVYPSLYEGFGLPVLEAMACGTPVICSNNSSLPEVGGNAVFYVDSRNFFDIKDKIKYLIHHPDVAQKLSQKGLFQSKKFTWEKTARKIFRFLQTL